MFYKYPDAYRSVFSKKYGSLEIPSAGIHFTWDLIQKIKDKGGLISFITLHVASTEMLSNRKIQTKCVEEVTISEEYYEVPQATADIINTAKQNGGRIFAVGTTVTRCLESAYSEKAMRLIRSGVTAIFCDDDLLAGAVYRACRQAGLRIPEDMSVVGFNDIEMARMLYPELTTVAIPAAGIGTMALEMFFANVLGNTGRANPEILELELVVRDSTCSPA